MEKLPRLFFLCIIPSFGECSAEKNQKNVMKPEVFEEYRKNPECELRLGVASWANGNDDIKSFKFTTFDAAGKAKRMGEMPVEALPQALEFAIREGYITL
jgi:hypothetical protein